MNGLTLLPVYETKKTIYIVLVERDGVRVRVSHLGIAHRATPLTIVSKKWEGSLIQANKLTHRRVGIRHRKQLLHFGVVSQHAAKRREKRIPGAVLRRQAQHVDIGVRRVDPDHAW